MFKIILIVVVCVSIVTASVRPDVLSDFGPHVDLGAVTLGQKINSSFLFYNQTDHFRQKYTSGFWQNKLIDFLCAAPACPAYAGGKFRVSCAFDRKSTRHFVRRCNFQPNNIKIPAICY